MKYIKILILFLSLISTLVITNVFGAASIKPSKYQLIYQGNTILNAKEEYKTTLRLHSINTQEIGYDRVKYQIDVLEGNKNKVDIYFLNKAKNYVSLKQTKEFDLPISYEETIDIKIMFKEEGNYKLLFKVVDFNNNIVAQEKIQMFVMESITTFGETKKINKNNKPILISTIAILLLFSLYIYLKDRIII